MKYLIIHTLFVMGPMGGSSNKSASCSNVIVVLHKKRLSIVRYGWTYLCDLSVFCKQNTKVTCVKGFINTDDRHYQSSIILLLATFIKCKKKSQKQLLQRYERP